MILECKDAVVRVIEKSSDESIKLNFRQRFAFGTTIRLEKEEREKLIEFLRNA